MLAGFASAASKIQMLISFHNLACAAQICTKMILFWITIIFDINTKHTHSCPTLLFPLSMGFSSQTEDITLLYVCLSQAFRSIQGLKCIVYWRMGVLMACMLLTTFKLDNYFKVKPDLKCSFQQWTWIGQLQKRLVLGFSKVPKGIRGQIFKSILLPLDVDMYLMGFPEARSTTILKVFGHIINSILTFSWPQYITSIQIS